MARLPYAPADGPVSARIRARRGGLLRPLDGMLLHNPKMADGWNTLLGAIRERTTVPPALRELVVLRIAVLNEADYEWHAHLSMAKSAGLGQDKLDAIRSLPPQLPDRIVPNGHSVPGPDGVFDTVELAVLGLVDAMTIEVRVPNAMFDTLRELFDDRTVVELIATVSAYNMVSRFLVALGIGADTLDGLE